MPFSLPNDPYILLSIINQKLRDYYPSLDALCDDLGVSSEHIAGVLASTGYRYDAAHNQFVSTSV